MTKTIFYGNGNKDKNGNKNGRENEEGNDSENKNVTTYKKEPFSSLGVDAVLFSCKLPFAYFGLLLPCFFLVSIPSFSLPFLLSLLYYRKQTNTTDTMDSSKIFAYILAILLPPLAVLMVSGVGMDLGINILFCILAWFPGMIHACYVVSKSE